MNKHVSKIPTYLAAMVFLFALVINVKVTIDDPFVMLSEVAMAQTTTSSTTTAELGCGGNVTYLKNATLRNSMCPFMPWKSYLGCFAEQNVCCDPSKQTTCSGNPW